MGIVGFCYQTLTKNIDTYYLRRQVIGGTTDVIIDVPKGIYMTKKITESDFTKRLKSLVWRAAMMGIAVAVSAIANNISSLNLDPSVTVFIGLVLGEISKYLNTQTK